MKHAKRKLGLLLAVMMLMQLVLPAVALADGPTTDLTGTEWLVVHGAKTAEDTTYDDNLLGGWSSVKVMNGDQPIDAVNGVYSNVPQGATVEIRYALHLEDRVVGESLIYYSSNDFFYLPLPQGIVINVPSDVSAGFDVSITTSTEVKTVSGQLVTVDDGSGNQVQKIKVTLSDDLSGLYDLWAAIVIKGAFSAVGSGVPSETELKLGSQTFTFKREMPDLKDTGLVKKNRATYDAANNEITWRVTVTPPNGVLLGGASLVDTFSPNQAYETGSFKINGNELTSEEATSFSYDSGTRTITYNFPADAAGTYEFTYITKPTDFSGETGATGAKSYDFTNDVKLMQGETKIKEDTDKVSANWVVKDNATYTKYDGTDGVFKWTVKVTVPGGSGTVTGAVITDTLPTGLALITDNSTTYPITISLNGGSATNVTAGADADAGTYSYADNKLVYRFPTGGMTNTATLTYYTKIVSRDDSIADNGIVTFNNEATLNWTENPNGSAPPKDIGKGEVPGGGLVKKSTSSAETYVYNNTTGTYIQWTITVNDNRVALKNAAISDEILAGQELVIDNGTHKFIVNRYSGTGTTPTSTVEITDKQTSGYFAYTAAVAPALEKFSYTFGDIPNTDYYKITYWTKLTQEGIDRFYANKDTAVEFSNTVSLTVDGVSKPPDTANKTFNHQLLDKTNAGYNYSERTTKWTVVVNRDQLPLHNAQVSDTLPSGMLLLIDGDHPFTVSPALSGAQTHTAENGKESFTVTLGDISAQYTITFYTKLTDEALKVQWNNNKPFTNTVNLSATELSGLSDTSTVQVRNPVVKKWHDTIDTKSGVIHWSVYLNLGMLTLTNASVTDKLNSGIALVENTVELYRCTGVTFDTNGQVSAVANRALVTFAENDVTYENNELTVKLPSGAASPYVFLLKFDTAIVDDNLGFNNEVTLSGATSSDKTVVDSERVSVSSYWSGGGGASYTYTLIKTSLPNGQGFPVPGATYRLVNAAGVPIKIGNKYVEKETDIFGKAEFTGLPERAFYAIEVNAPDGYLLSTDLIALVPNGTAETHDDPVEIGVLIHKVSTAGINFNVSGGQFGIYAFVNGQAGDTPIKTASSVSGIVNFGIMPEGDYIIKEITAPSGYYRTDETIEVSVSRNADQLETDITYVNSNAKFADENRNYMENAPVPVANGTLVRIHKVDAATGKSLAGAEFTLYGASGTALQTVTTNADGYAWFTQVPDGNYTIRETKAPIGYYAAQGALVLKADGSFVEYTVKNSLGGSRVPVTGDETGVLGFALMGAALLLGLAAVKKRRDA